MSFLSHFFALNPRLGWLLVVLLASAIGLLSGVIDHRLKQDQRLTMLATEAQRSSVEIMSTTLNGNLMGSITLLGLVDPDIKQDASNGLLSINANIAVTLSTLGNSFGAEGIFVVGEDGLVKTSWDRINKPSTGLDVSFRPYYKMAMRGQTNVYAAVSMARGDRSIYFSAPVFSERARSSTGIGAVVARTNLAQVDKLLGGKFDIALLLSPQGVVFASNQPEWLGYIEGEPTASQLREIRELKQFGSLFEKTDPKVLPFSSKAELQQVSQRFFAAAAAPVKWNDPSGDWKLLVLEDLSHSVPMVSSASLAATAALLTLLLGWMMLYLLRGQYAQTLTNQQLQAFARLQEDQVAFRAHLSELSLKLQRCHTLDRLAATFLQDSRDLLGTTQGVLYVTDVQQIPPVLRLVGVMACASEPPALLTLGETLLGQCALERRLQVITTPPGGYWSVRSGLGNTPPAALLLAPMVSHDKLVGAVELALRKLPDAAAQERLAQAIDLLATALEILLTNLQLRQLAQSDAHTPGATP